MDQNKSDFLQTGIFLALQDLQENSMPAWGIMGAQEMVEHLADFFDVSSAKIHIPLAVPEDHLPKYKAFLFSDKQFRENTKAPASVLGEMPLPLRTASLQVAKENLQQSVRDFYQFFQQYPGAQTLHPVFGVLTLDEWILLHYKHVTHHLRQFRLLPALVD